MIYCIIGRNGVCNNDFSSGCYKCCMAMCYDDSREVMELQKCVRQAMELISALQKESVSPAVFLKQPHHFFRISLCGHCSHRNAGRRQFTQKAAMST